MHLPARHLATATKRSKLNERAIRISKSIGGGNKRANDKIFALVKAGLCLKTTKNVVKRLITIPNRVPPVFDKLFYNSAHHIRLGTDPIKNKPRYNSAREYI